MCAVANQSHKLAALGDHAVFAHHLYEVPEVNILLASKTFQHVIIFNIHEIHTIGKVCMSQCHNYFKVSEKWCGHGRNIGAGHGKAFISDGSFLPYTICGEYNSKTFMLHILNKFLIISILHQQYTMW